MHQSFGKLRNEKAKLFKKIEQSQKSQGGMMGLKPIFSQQQLLYFS